MRRSMEEKNKVPLLLEFLFGESAETARRRASPRLRRWGEAFEEWIAEQGRRCKPSTSKHAKTTWRRLLRERRASRSGSCPAVGAAG